MVKTGVSVKLAGAWFVLEGRKVGVVVAVDTTGVTDAPITTGVGLLIDGVRVGGRNGVGCGSGLTTQPLQDDRTIATKISKVSLFIYLLLHFIVSGMT